jgi:hypothetical protein
MKGFQLSVTGPPDSAPPLLTSAVGDDSVSILDLIMNRRSIDGILLGRADD